MFLLYSIILVTALMLFVTLANCLFWPRVANNCEPIPACVSVLIPARNEEANLPGCLDAVLTHQSGVREILIYDDQSTDKTATVISEYAAINSLIKAIPTYLLPTGWCGKNYACAQLANAATSEWLLFLDADSRLLSYAIPRIVREAQKRNLTFMSCWPKFITHGLAEKILMPFLNFVVFSIFPGPMSLIEKPEFQYRASLGLAHGSCMLFRRDEYESFGGHAKVKDQIFEDTRLAQLWRTSGRKGLCLDGQDVISLRMYSSLSEIWFGFQKNFYPAFTAQSSFWLFIGLHFLVYFSPFIAVLIWNNPLIKLTIAGIFLIRTLVAARFNQSILSIIFHPFGEAVLVLIGLASWWHCRTGRGVRWKGREYLKRV